MTFLYSVISFLTFENVSILPPMILSTTALLSESLNAFRISIKMIKMDYAKEWSPSSSLLSLLAYLIVSEVQIDSK